MRVVLQRVSEASVKTGGRKISSIKTGVMILLGIENDDQEEDVRWLVKKIVDMRIFPDDEGKMNLSLCDVGGEMMVVSQFTLHASVKKGNRPSFIRAARPDKAVPLYEYFIRECKNILGDFRVQQGSFGADMLVSLCNDGPVTIIMDSKNRE